MSDPRGRARRVAALLVPLATARLVLEPVRARHAGDLYAGLCDPSLYTYEVDAPPDSLAMLRADFARRARGASYRGAHHLVWAIVERETAHAVGLVRAFFETDEAEPFISYIVVAKHQRRAYGREAVAALCAHLRAAGIGVIRAEIDVRHRASIALVEAVGFERADTYRSADLIGGLRGYDHLYELRAPRAGAAAAPNPGS